jgi:colanic acid biosynthesis protein WcaH
MSLPPLPIAEFSAACAALPLVSIDLVLINPAGQLLLGLRNNAPACGWWFTPGGRIRKNEPLADAKLRVAQDELGLPALALARAIPMGAWDHFYPDSAFDPGVSTHYVNLPLWLALTPDEEKHLQLPQGAGEQHARWQWLALDQAAGDGAVHAYVRVYAQWVLQQTR